MRLFSFLLVSVFCVSGQATEMVGALSAGMGGTGRAAVESHEAIFLNPAALALMNKFYAGTSYQSGMTQRGVNRKTYSMVLTDGSKGLMFPGSLGYRRHSIEAGQALFKEDEFRAGVGYRLHPRLNMGLSVNHLRAEQSNGQQFNQTNFDAGLLIGLQPNWGLSFNGENLLGVKDDVPEALQRVSRIAIGTQFIHQPYLTLRYETLMPLTVENTQYLGHRVGVAIAMQSYLQLSGGFSVDDARGQNWSSVGLAWKGPRLKLAYSYQTETRQELGDRHLVDLWMDL